MGDSPDDTKLRPGFRSRLLQKLWNRDCSDLAEPGILLEVAIISIPVVFATLGSLRLWNYNRTSWNKRTFRNKINVSLNMVEQNAHGQWSIKFRTLGETTINNVLFNTEGEKVLSKASFQTTRADPFIKLDPPHHWNTYNAVCNYISSMNALGYLQKDILGPKYVQSTWYTMALTCEHPDAAVSTKIRAMLIKTKDIHKLAALDDTVLSELEYAFHKERWEVLLKMSKLYKQQREELKAERSTGSIKASESTHFFNIEFCVPKAHAESLENNGM